MPEPVQDERPFYVGYLPLPPAIRRFLVPWLAGNLVLVVAVAVLLASQQRDPGDGVWDTGSAVTLEGYLRMSPYPVLIVDGPEGRRSVLPVEQGKIGSQDRLAGFADSPVRLTGFVIERHGNQILELLPGDAGVEPLAGTQPVRWTPQEVDLGTHELVGEIVDPKCYLGVMKPGDGKPHKVCATLCISGGIPPMLVVRDAAGQTTAYLLTGAGGEAMPTALYGYIADPVRVTGRVLRRDGQLVLQADWATLARLE